MKKIALIILIIFTVNCLPVFANSFDDIVEIDVSSRMGAQIGEITELDENLTYNLFELSSADDIDDSFYKEFYGYNKMQELDKKNNTKLAGAYLTIAEGVKEKREMINVKNFSLSLETMRMVYHACLNDLPEIYYANKGFRYAKDFSVIAPGYIENNWQSELFEKKAEEIIKKSGVRPEMSEYDKALMIHDELALAITYNQAVKDAQNIEDEEERNEKLDEVNAEYPYIHTAYGAIVMGDAVCDGYAKAYQYLLRKVGIVSHIAIGVGHAWNLVNIDDEWCYTDLTWNDTDNGSLICYSHFNGTYDHFVSTGHKFNSPYELPRTENVENFYYEKNNLIFDEIDAQKLSKQLENGFTVRAFVTGDQDAVFKWLNNKEKVLEVVEKAGYDCISFSRYYNPKNKEFIITYKINQLELSKNMVIRIGSITDKTVKVYQAFYDSDWKLLNAHIEENVELISEKGAKEIKISSENEPEKFAHLKVFVWDDEKGFIPLYNFRKMDY